MSFNEVATGTVPAMLKYNQDIALKYADSTKYNANDENKQEAREEIGWMFKKVVEVVGEQRSNCQGGDAKCAGMCCR